MAKRASPTLIGAFVIGGMILAVLVVVLFGSGRFFRHTHEFVTYFSGSVNGLRVGASVKFKGVEVGSVKQILLRFERGAVRVDEQFYIPVIIELDEDKLAEKGARATHLEKQEVLDNWIKSGLRAQMLTESYVTGVLYVALDFRPDTPASFVGLPGLEYREIPVIPTPLEEVQSEAQRILAKIEEIKLKETVDAANELLHSVNDLVSSPKINAVIEELQPTLAEVREAMSTLRRVGGDLGEQLEPMTKSIEVASTRAAQALEQAQATLKSAGGTIEPGSPIMYQMGETLRDVGEAARAMRELAEYLERNPDALLRGKAVGQ